MRKPAFCICINVNKGTDQLPGNPAADHRLWFRCIVSTFPLLSKRNFQASFCGCTTLIMSDLVGSPEERFSHDAAQLKGKVVLP